MEYDGTDFAGFQYQLDVRSVQSVIEEAVKRITGQAVRVSGAGRTDAGVHALGQVVGFTVDTRIPLDRMVPALNSGLPVDVRIGRVDEVGPEFHARFDAVSRKYVYLILNRRAPSALFGRYSWHVPHRLDAAAMHDAGMRLQGEFDYAAWANDLREARTSVRRLTRCAVRARGPFVMVAVEANAFLKGMVRNIVGTLEQVGCGRRLPDDMDRITRSLDRGQAGPTAPARGLCLVRVRY